MTLGDELALALPSASAGHPSAPRVILYGFPLLMSSGSGDW